MSKQAKTQKVDTPDAIAQAEWTTAIGRVILLALELWNLVAKGLRINESDFRMEHGLPSDFEGANADDIAIIRQRDTFCAQLVFWGNPFINSYHQALAAFMAGLWKSLSTDVEGESRAKLSKSELKAVMTASRKGDAKQKQVEGLYAFLEGLGFSSSFDALGYRQWTMTEGPENGGKLSELRSKIVADLNAIEAENSFPVSIARPSKDDAENAKKTRAASGRSKYVDLIVSCGCTVTETRSKPSVIAIKKLAPKAAAALVGMPCPACGFTSKEKDAVNPKDGRFVKETKAVIAKLAKAAAVAEKKTAKPKSKRAA